MGWLVSSEQWEAPLSSLPLNLIIFYVIGSVFEICFQDIISWTGFNANCEKCVIVVSFTTVGDWAWL